MKRYNLLIYLILLLCFFHVGFADQVWTYNQDTGNYDKTGTSTWSKSDSYANGWSEWSTEQPDTTKFAYAEVYLAGDFTLSSEICNNDLSEVKTCEGENCSVRQKSDEQTKYYKVASSTTTTTCSGNWEDYKSSYNTTYKDSTTDKNCKTKLGTTGTGYCVSPSAAAGLCSGGATCGSPEAKEKGFTKECTWILWETTITETKTTCGTDLQDKATSCGKETIKCYKTTCEFKASDAQTKAEANGKWYVTAKAAGDYAKKIKIYSYPLVNWIVYDGNGHDNRCENWQYGTNSYTESKVEYNKGNPVCNANFVNGNMPSGSNIYIDYCYDNSSEHKALLKNQYHRVGYDFTGWSLSANGDVIFTDEEEIDPSTDERLQAFEPGETITLYAVWQIHDYTITYSSICGQSNHLANTYNYGTGLTLGQLNTATCTGTNKNSFFEGWYDGQNKLTVIPSTYHEDLTLYAKLSQNRYYNYRASSWLSTSNTTN